MYRSIAVTCAAAALFYAALPVRTSAYSWTEAEKAVLYLSERSIMVGDSSGDMRLNDTLSRSELAVILTRISDEGSALADSEDYYSNLCAFGDVPAWARPYVGYCSVSGFMIGYTSDVFGAADPVTVSDACTVALRCLDYPTHLWDYSSSVQTALELGLLPQEAVLSPEISRGDIAVMLYRMLSGTQTATVPGASASASGFLVNGKPITEENVLELLRELETRWPTGTLWGTHDTPNTNKNEVPCTQARNIMNQYRLSEYYGCSGYAAMVSSLIFGDSSNPGRRLDDLSQIRPGDIIFRVHNETGNVWHVVVALESPNENHAFHVTEGNVGATVQWPDQTHSFGRNNLDSFGGDGKTYHLEVWTRYPEGIPFTGSANAWPTGNT